MTQLLPWVFLFTLPGLILGSAGVVRRPGIASQVGPLAILACAVTWLLGADSAGIFRVTGWLPFVPDGSFFLRADALAAYMLAILGVVSSCVYIYSLSYLRGDPGQRRFFAFLDVFVGAMALLVLAGNVAVLLIGWTGVGVTSFLLISFWRQRAGTLGAGLQALAANAIGDAALILVAVLLPAGCGDLATLANPECSGGLGGAALLGGLLVIAASAKSAQGPLYFWLPSAMAGPTPISALIHAATMVAAGVYLLARTSTLLAQTPALLLAVAALGTATAIGGGLCALRQSNLKRGLAYSTVSQLGYMFAGIGFGAPFAALFHLGSQAFFKAGLFLAAGVVIHALDGEEELARLGRLSRPLRAAWLTFLVCALSLFGFPLTAGWFSKDALLEAGLAAPDGFLQLLSWLLILTVALSGLYSGRLFFATFYGPPGPPRTLVHPPDRWLLLPLAPLAVGALLFGFSQWPFGGMGHVLAPVLGEVHAQALVSPEGLLAAALGLAGFASQAWWQRRPRHLADTAQRDGWVQWTASGGAAVGAWVAGVHNGRTGRYVLATVLGFAILLVAGLRA